MATNTGRSLFKDNFALQPEDSFRRTSSIQSFYSTNGSSDGETGDVLNEFGDVMMDYPVNSHGKYQLRLSKWSSDGNIGRSFRRKVKRIAGKEKRSRPNVNAQTSDEDAIEVPRGHPVPARISNLQKTKALDCLVNANYKANGEAEDGFNVAAAKNRYKELRMKAFAARSAMDMEPTLVVRTRNALDNRARARSASASEARLFDVALSYDPGLTCPTSGKGGERAANEAMNVLVDKCTGDDRLKENMLFNPRFDSKWKNRHTVMFMKAGENGNKKKRPVNGQGWVLPLANVCSKFEINSSFFTNRRIDLQSARDQVMLLRLTNATDVSPWLSEFDPSAMKNEVMLDYLATQFDPATMKQRLRTYKDNMIADKDKIRVIGQYYNNISIGKRMFGAARKQKFLSTIIGGMERRFEILDNPVNHIPFTHSASDANVEKCRNQRIHCKDESRVRLTFPAVGNSSDFIHANRISGGSLFNEFIVTQAPMDDSIDDFWRMVWQEEVPYIVMLVSRKDESRCARYWPRTQKDASIEVSGGVRVENWGTAESPDPLFRATRLRLVGPNREERHVEHWQGEMNNASNLISPLNILRLLRNTSRPVVVHDCLGISRASCLVATEIAICNIIKGPTYKYPVQRAVQFLRKHRPFSIETPMQYIFVHRLVNYFFRDFIGNIKQVEADYDRWLCDRSGRMFFDDLAIPVPGYRLLSPKIDPDLLRLVGRPERPNHRREAPDCIGQMPGAFLPGVAPQEHAKRTLNFNP